MNPTKEFLERISTEEASLLLDRFDEEDAWRLGLLLVEEAKIGRAHV